MGNILGKRGRRQQHGPISGDHGLRAQHVHALRPRDPRHQLERKQGHAPLGHRPRVAGHAQRIAQADHGLPGAQLRQIGAAGLRIGAQRTHLQHAIGRQGLVARDDLGPFFGVALVGKASRHAGPRLDPHLAAQLDQTGNRPRHQRHAPLAGKRFFNRGNNHEIYRNPGSNGRSRIRNRRSKQAAPPPHDCARLNAASKAVTIPRQRAYFFRAESPKWQ